MIDVNIFFAAKKQTPAREQPKPEPKIEKAKVEKPKVEKPKVEKAKEQTTEKESTSRPYIVDIYAGARTLSGRHHQWSRQIEFRLSDGNLLNFYWDDKGKLYYWSGKPEGYMGEFIRKNESYELVYEDGRIKEVRVPEFITENPDLFSPTDKIKTTDGTPPKPRQSRKPRAKPKVHCSTHKSYTGRTKPKTDCLECLNLYKERHPEEFDA